MLTPDGVYVDALVPSVREVWGHELTAESFARGEFTADGLAAADAVVGTLADLPAAVAALGR